MRATPPTTGGAHNAEVEVQRFVAQRCVVASPVWSYRAELWGAYAKWAGLNRICKDRAEMEAALSAAGIAIVGISKTIISGVGLRDAWQGRPH